MRSSLLANAALCATTASAYLSLPVTRVTDGVPHTTKHRRASTNLRVSGALPANYVTNITIGTPPQEFQVLVSINVASSWVPDAATCDSSYDYYNTCDWGSRKSS